MSTLDFFGTRLLPFLEAKAGKFITFHARPMRSAAVGTWSDPLKNEPPYAIVMQGPLLLKDDFTLETIKIYKKHFEKAVLIVSTWEGEDAAAIADIERAGAVVLQNKEPVFPGQQHINFQLVSSLAGMHKAQELGAQYVLKTRTDQRMYAPNISEFLFSLLAAFPLPHIEKQKGRLIGLGLNTYKYRPYSLSDMFLFGKIEDMLLYWSADLVSEAQVPTGICEAYLCTEFLKKVGGETSWTIRDSWKAYAEHFCIVDADMLDLYWHKYRRYLHNAFLSYESIRSNQKLPFREWLNLYSGRENKKQIPEEFRDLKGFLKKP